jgi:hypothetical protein
MKSNSLFLAISVIVFGLVACVEQADLDPRERAVVVKCILTEDSVQTLELKYTSYISESHYPPVEEAEVYIEYIASNKVEERYDFEKVKDGLWHSAFTTKGNRKYRLTVKVPGFETISATTVYPLYNVRLYSYVFDKSKPASMKYGFYADGKRWADDDDNSNIDIPPQVSYDGWSAEKRFFSMYPYFIHASRQYLEYKFDRPWGEYIDKSYVDPAEDSDSCAVWVYGMDYNPVMGKFEQTGYIYTTHHVADNYNITTKKGKDIPEFSKEQCTVGVPEILEYGIPMYHATTSTYYNISQERMYAYSLRFPVCDLLNPGDGFYNVEYHQIIPNFKQYYNGVAHPKAHLVAELVNKDYDKYLKSVMEFHLGLGWETAADELTRIYDYREVKTNIVNGLGVFGASYKSMRRWAMPENIYYFPYEKSTECIEYENSNYLPSLTPSEDKKIIQGYYKEAGI